MMRSDRFDTYKPQEQINTMFQLENVIADWRGALCEVCQTMFAIVLKYRYF